MTQALNLCSSHSIFCPLKQSFLHKMSGNCKHQQSMLITNPLHPPPSPSNSPWDGLFSPVRLGLILSLLTLPSNDIIEHECGVIMPITIRISTKYQYLKTRMKTDKKMTSRASRSRCLQTLTSLAYHLRIC